MDGRFRSPLTCVSYEKRDRVAFVTLDRPQVLNAMNATMYAELSQVWSELESDSDVLAGVIRGAGERAFSVGQDLKELAAHDAAGSSEVSTFGSAGKPGAPRLTDRFDITKPLIAQVRGFALGGGFELAMACDLVIAATDAQFALPEVRLGLVAGAGGLFRLPRQIPPRIALGYAITGRRLSANEALTHGLVNEVVAPDDLERATMAWVEDILAAAPLSVRATREVIWRSLDVPLAEAFTRTYPQEELRKSSADAIEGPRAFADGREPRWRGE